MSFWPVAWKDAASDWTYVQIPPDRTPDKLASDLLVKDKKYLNVVLRSMRIVNLRKGLAKFYGTVHSVISVPYMTGKPAVFHSISTPGELLKVDAANIDRVIVTNRRLVGPVPYRGGDVEVELGLFSIKEADLAAPFLHLLESISKTAGDTFVNAALPFVGLLAEGVRLLAGSDANSTLEIGLSTTYDQLRTGYFAVIRASRGSIDPSSLRVDWDRKLVDHNTGKAVAEYPYIVFSIEGSPEREDWFQIPEIAASHTQLRDVIMKLGTQKEIDDAFRSFKLTTLTSPDLLTNDAKKIVQKVQDDVYSTWSRGTGGRPPGSRLTDLKQLDIYDKERQVALSK